jgi:hypothetical protein
MSKKNVTLFVTIFSITLLTILGFNLNKVTYSQSNPSSLDSLIHSINVNYLQESDQKTREFIQKIVNPDLYSEPNFTALSCQDLKRIDQKWLIISNNKFGFSPQYKIWQAIKKVEQDPAKRSKMLGDRLGWTRQQPLTEEEYISPNWLYSDELDYSLKAPVGHLPWSGINAETIRDMISNAGPGCGSCTIDAISLQNDRFERYIPALFNHYEQCLKVN